MKGNLMAIGFGCGVLGTIVMSIPMIAATATGLSPMTKPIPASIIGMLFGAGIPKPLLIVLAAGSHLIYGGAWAAALTVLRRRTVWTGVALGIGLWLIMQLVVLPILGWGVFGTAITPKIAAATLVLHLIYGATTGYLLQRFTTDAPDEFQAINTAS